MTAPDCPLRLIQPTYETTELPTWHTDNLWGFPRSAWRIPAALAVGVAAGWLLRGAR